MEHTIELLQISGGQDKVLRVLQYSLRFIIFSNKCIDYSFITKLEEHLTIARKITRISRDLAYFNKGVVALQNPDRIDGFGRAISGFGKCVWLLSDHIELLYRIGVLQSASGITPAAKWSKISNWLWLLGYLGSIGLYARQLKIIKNKIKLKTYYDGSEIPLDSSVQKDQDCNLEFLRDQYEEIKLQMLQEFIDCGIPAGGLGLIPPALGSVAGAISSFIGIYQISLSVSKNKIVS